MTWAAVAGLLAAAGAGLWAWEPWADRSAFTATVTGASPLEEPAAVGETCTPRLAGETVVIYDASGKRMLASGIESGDGEVLPSSYGEVAGWCFHATLIEGLPGGEGTYQVQVGGGNLVTVEEDHLRISANQQREALKDTQQPSSEPDGLTTPSNGTGR